MAHVDIRLLARFSADELKRIATGYTATSRFEVCKSESAERMQFTLELQPLDTPFVKVFDWDDEQLQIYERVVAEGLSLGAYDRDALIGIAINERQNWNNSLSVWEFHIAPSHRGQGIGRLLMSAVIEQARQNGLRAIVCETQNTNPMAIHFYQRMGFEMDGIDLSLYPQEVGDEIALFMKCRL